MSINYRVSIQALDPTCADVRIEFDDLPAGAEVRGRLMGPRCPQISTVEVAYKLRQVPGTMGTYQVIIPEPNLWTPQRPFRYEGPVEVWCDGLLVDQVAISVGLK